MDEMALLERFRSDVEIDHASLVRSRRRVLRRALVLSGAGRRRRRLVLAAAAAVAVVAGALAVTGGGPTASPAAAAVLARAAAAAGEDGPGPGEYLHVREVTTRWYGDGPEVTVQEQWLPGDPGEPTVFVDSDGFVYRSSSGVPEIYGRPDLSTEDLLAWLRRPNGDLEGDDAAYERAGEVLAPGTAPAAFQAALFTALRDIEGVEVVDDDARVAGRDVVVIGRGEPLETQFLFDERSGALVGFQGVGDPDVGSRLAYRTLLATSITDDLPGPVGRGRPRTSPGLA